MHKNPRFNILQAEGNCNPNFVVIDGQRTNSGGMAHGAKVLTTPMSRELAIAVADKMEAELAVKRADAIARANVRQALAKRAADHAAKVKDMRDVGAFKCLLIMAGMPLVRFGGAGLRDLREDVFDAANNTNGRAGVHGIGAIYDSAMMGGEPFAVWN